MRSPFRWIVAPLLVLAPSLAAQGFEGTLSMKVMEDGGPPMVIDWTLKGTKHLMMMQAPPGPLSGMEIKMIIDLSTQVGTLVMPMPPSMARAMPNVPGMLIVVKPDAKTTKAVADSAATSGRGLQLKKLGTSQTIAGVSCDDYELNDSLKTRACLASSLGKFSFPSVGGLGGRGAVGGMGGAMSLLPDWTASLTGGAFPLKIIRGGKTVMEVTGISKGAVSPDIFQIPEGYVDMSAMLSGMGRGRAGGH